MKSRFYNFIIILFLLTPLCWSQIPPTISYQGVLTDREGNPVRDSDYELTFILYDAAVEGKALWKEIQKLPITKGVMNAILGSAEKLALPFDKPYWLGITIGEGTELTPRIQLTATAYSLSSKGVSGETNVFPSDGNVGIGTPTPGEKLTVDGNIYARGSVTLEGGIANPQELSIQSGTNFSMLSGMDMAVSSARNIAFASGSDFTIAVGKRLAIDAGQEYSSQSTDSSHIASRKIVLLGDDQIILKCGDASITLLKNGDITIKGKNINIRSEGDVVIKGNRIYEN